MSFIHELDSLVEASANPLLGANESWARVRLSEVATITNGFAFASAKFSKDRGKPLVRIRDIVTGSTTARFDGPFDAEYLVQPGDLLVGMDGEFKVGRWSGPEALLNQRVCRLVTNERLYLSRFLELALPGYLAAIHDRTSSQTVKHLSSRTIAEIPLPLPPLAEQKRIVEKVEALLAQVRAARDRLERVQQILKRFRQAVLAAAVDGRLTRGYSVTAGADSRWQVRRLGELARVLGGKRLPKGREYAPTETPHPFLRVVDLDGMSVRTSDLRFLDERTHRELQRYTISSEDVYISIAGSIGKVGLVPDDLSGSNLTENAAKITRLNGVTREFLAYYLNSPAGQQQIADETKATGQPKLALFRIESIPIPVPPLDEQHEIANRVTALLSLSSSVANRAMAGERLTAVAFRSILARAFAGKLVPTEAELAQAEERPYESRDELLARVTSRRGGAAPPSHRTGATRKPVPASKRGTRR